MFLVSRADAAGQTRVNQIDQRTGTQEGLAQAARGEGKPLDELI